MKKASPGVIVIQDKGGRMREKGETANGERHIDVRKVGI